MMSCTALELHGAGNADPGFQPRFDAELYRCPDRSYLPVMRHLALALLMTLPTTVLASEHETPPTEQEGGMSTSQAQGSQVDENTPDTGSETAMPDGILVKFDEKVRADQIETINRRLGVTIVNTMQDGRLMLVQTPYPNVLSQLIDAYQATEGVEYAEPNSRVSIPEPPGDWNAGSPDTGQGGGGLPPADDGSAPLMPLPGVD